MKSDDFERSLEDNITNGLPEGWASAQVRELMNLINGYPFKPSQWKDNGLPIIRIQNLNNPDAPFNYCSDDIPEKYLIKNGDLLFAWSGTPGTSFGAHLWNGGNAWLNQHIFRVEFNETLLDKRFLRLAINHNLNDYIAQAQGGVGLAHITKSKFEPSFLRIPPLAEQKRIVRKIEELLARVNSTKERMAKVSMILKRFRQTVLTAACSGRLTAAWRNGKAQLESGQAALQRIFGNKTAMKVPSVEDPFEPPEIPEEWTWTRCEFLCEPERIITYGVIKLGPNTKNGIGTLRSSDVRWLYIENDNVKCISTKIAARYSRTFLRGGEILITVRGSLGGVAVVPKEMAGCNISREVAMLPLHPELNPQFFSYAIASIWSQNWLSEVTKGVAYTGINIRDLKRLPLPVPPIAEQHEIFRRVETMLRLAEAVEKRVATSTVRTESLIRAILAKAFRGELVPTEAELARREGRSYEPASDLLARIKSQRDAKQVSQKVRGNRN